MNQLNEQYIKQMKGLLGEEFEAYISSFDEERTYGLRANGLKITTESLRKDLPFELNKIPWTENGFYFGSDIQPAKNPYYFAGLFYIQEPSAMMPVSIMPIKEGDRVLDLCAAPGGKSTQIADKLNNTGLLVSNDISSSRIKAVARNIEMHGIKNSIILSESPEKLGDRFEGYFDHILVDAPCSGEGMFRKDPSMIKTWSKDTNMYYQKIQKEILISANKMLKKDGYLAYSTCTFAREENEDVIEWFANEFGYEIVNIDLPDGIKDRVDNHYVRDEEMKKTLRLFPHRIKGEGHFVALLRKKSDSYEANITLDLKAPKEKELESFNEFSREYLNLSFDKNRLFIKNDKIYYLPKDMPDLKGLRVFKNGWQLGELKRNRFEPSQSFASGLSESEFKNIVSLELDDIRVIKYLKGESIEGEANKGYNLISLNHHPLGFAKKANSLLKNKFSASWRLL